MKKTKKASKPKLSEKIVNFVLYALFLGAGLYIAFGFLTCLKSGCRLAPGM